MERHTAERSRYWQPINHQQWFWKDSITNIIRKSYQLLRIIMEHDHSGIQRKKERILNLETVRWPYTWAWPFDELFHRYHAKPKWICQIRTWIRFQGCDSITNIIRNLTRYRVSSDQKKRSIHLSNQYFHTITPIGEAIGEDANSLHVDRQ